MKYKIIKLLYANCNTEIKDLHKLYNEFLRGEVMAKAEEEFSKEDKELFDKISDAYRQSIYRAFENDKSRYVRFGGLTGSNDRKNFFRDAILKAVYNYSSLYVWLSKEITNRDFNDNKDDFVRAFKLCANMDIDWYLYVNRYEESGVGEDMLRDHFQNLDSTHNLNKYVEDIIDVTCEKGLDESLEATRIVEKNLNEKWVPICGVDSFGLAKSKSEFNPEEVEMYINKYSTITTPYPKLDLDFKVSAEDMEIIMEFKNKVLKRLEGVHKDD